MNTLMIFGYLYLVESDGSLKTAAFNYNVEPYYYSAQLDDFFRRCGLPSLTVGGARACVAYRLSASLRIRPRRSRVRSPKRDRSRPSPRLRPGPVLSSSLE